MRGYLNTLISYFLIMYFTYQLIKNKKSNLYVGNKFSPTVGNTLKQIKGCVWGGGGGGGGLGRQLFVFQYVF